jgi:drug/metabolite transporter (DMT)-like permease
MVAQELAGMLLMAVAGITESSLVIFSTVMKQMDLPFYPVVGTAQIPLLIWLLLRMFYSRRQLPELSLKQVKWIWLRGFFGCCTLVLALSAVAMGAPIGDASALGTINVVVAAFAGRVFLGERLGALHIGAVGASFVGAILVSKPETLLGMKQLDGGLPWLGYLLAVASGVASGILFIALRKSQNVDSAIMTCSLVAQMTVGCWAVAFSGIAEDAPLEALVESPIAALAWLVLILVLDSTNSVSTTVGAQRCPAAASSTLFTSTQMVSGYVADVFIHGTVPDVLTIVGASLMLLAVVVMAVAANGASAPADLPVDPPAACSSQAFGDATLVNDDDTDSLVSFVASEFSGCRPTRADVRQRSVQSSAVAQVVGATWV